MQAITRKLRSLLLLSPLGLVQPWAIAQQDCTQFNHIYVEPTLDSPGYVEHTKASKHVLFTQGAITCTYTGAAGTACTRAATY